MSTTVIRRLKNVAFAGWFAILGIAGVASIYAAVFALAWGLDALGFDKWIDPPRPSAAEAHVRLAEATYSELSGTAGCTADCAGHEAGFRWARRNEIADPADCGGLSRSFVEGCLAYRRLPTSPFNMAAMFRWPAVTSPQTQPADLHPSLERDAPFLASAISTGHNHNHHHRRGGRRVRRPHCEGRAGKPARDLRDDQQRGPTVSPRPGRPHPLARERQRSFPAICQVHPALRSRAGDRLPSAAECRSGATTILRQRRPLRPPSTQPPPPGGHPTPAPAHPSDAGGAPWRVSGAPSRG